MDVSAYMKSRFPEMTPITRVPTLSDNGIWFAMHGKRDYDAETQSYVATHFFCLLAIPVFALGAYRVVDARPGWFFLGRVPVSGLARAWNVVLPLLILLGSGGAFGYKWANNPERIAANRIATGDQLAAAGKIGAAAGEYHQTSITPAGVHSGIALQKLCDLFEAPMDKFEGGEVATAFTVGYESFKLKQRPERLFEAGLKEARARADKDALTARKLLEVITPLAPPGDKELAEVRRPIVIKLVAENPDDLDALCDLALVYEAERKLDECVKLLTPKRDKLGTREGARILGQIHANKGELETAVPLLQTYVDERLPRVIAADRQIKQLTNGIFEQLKNGTASGFDFQRAGMLKANPQAQNEMVQQYLQNRLAGNPEYFKAKNAYDRETRVIQAAFNLGMALLRQSQTMEDPNARRKQLEKAETTFLGLQEVLGRSDEVRVTLGQVYYWMGQQDKARKVFDEVMQTTNRAGRTLLAVAGVLREIGEVSEARKLAEEAYEKEPPGFGRDNAAVMRGLMALDLDDRILWLGRVQKQDGHQQAELCTARGEKANQENRDADAERELREALGHYAKLKEDTATLNNSALAYFALYRVTGNLKELNQGIANLEKAVELDHRNSILVHNAADSLMSNSMRALLGDELDWKALRTNGSMDLLGYFYKDNAGRDLWREKFRKHAGIAKARAFYERLLVLAPKNSRHYAVLSSIYTFAQDHDAIKQLRDRTVTAQFDHADTIRLLNENYQNVNSETRVRDLKGAIAVDEKRVAQARKLSGANPIEAPRGSGVTLAVALGRLIRNQIGLMQYDNPIDMNRLVSLAEEAHKIAPSRATETMLIEALHMRLHRDMIAKDKLYASMAGRVKRSLSPQYLIPIALEQPGPTRKALEAHPDFQRANALMKTLCETYSEEFTTWNWAVLRHAEPAWAAEQTKGYLGNEIAQASTTIANRVSPTTAGGSYLQAWHLRMRGQDAEADAVLRRCAAQGIPMPIAK